MKLRKLTLRLLLTINACDIIIMLLVGLSDRINPISHPVLSLAGLTFPLWLTVNMLFLVLWLCLKWQYALLPVAGLLLGFHPVRAYFPLNAPQEKPAKAVKVLSYNVESYGYGKAWLPGHKYDENDIVDYISHSGADIICLQEASQQSMNDRLDAELRTRLPYEYHCMSDSSGEMIKIYSRWPFIKTERVHFKSYGNLSIAAWVKAGDKRIAIINNHLESNKLEDSDKTEFKTMVKGEASMREMRSSSETLIHKLESAAVIRSPQADAVHNYVNRCLAKGMSVILCGDFNDTPISYTHRTIGKGLTDCYITTANGAGFSYHKSGMLVRIDNIMCSPDITPYNAKVDNSIGKSDHYPIMCWLDLNLNS